MTGFLWFVLLIVPGRRRVVELFIWGVGGGMGPVVGRGYHGWWDAEGMESRISDCRGQGRKRRWRRLNRGEADSSKAGPENSARSISTIQL